MVAFLLRQFLKTWASPLSTTTSARCDSTLGSVRPLSHSFHLEVPTVSNRRLNFKKCNIKSSNKTGRNLIQRTLRSASLQQATIQKHPFSPSFYLKLPLLKPCFFQLCKVLYFHKDHVIAGHCAGNSGDKAQQYELLIPLSD